MATCWGGMSCPNMGHASAGFRVLQHRQYPKVVTKPTSPQTQTTAALRCNGACVVVQINLGAFIAPPEVDL